MIRHAEFQMIYPDWFASQQNFPRKARNWENFDAFVNIDLGIFFWGSDSGVNSIKWSWFICRLLLHGYSSNILHMYGTDGVTKMDEFSENFRTAFDPPPPPAPFSGKMLRFFQKFMTTSTEFATKFFRSEMTPPLISENFPKIHPFWCGQASLSRLKGGYR